MGIVEAFAVRCKMVDKSGQVEWHDRLRALGVRRKIRVHNAEDVDCAGSTKIPKLPGIY
jgi:hypothetical protein